MDTNKSSYIISEDWQAIWAAVFIIFSGLLVYYFQKPDNLERKYYELSRIQDAEERKAPFRTMKWYSAKDEKLSQTTSNTSFGRNIRFILSPPEKWSDNPLRSFYLSEQDAEKLKRKSRIAKEFIEYEESGAYNKALLADLEAQLMDYKNYRLNNKASDRIEKWRLKREELDAQKRNIEVEPFNKIRWLLLIFIIFAIIYGAAIAFTGEAFGFFASGFALIFAISVIAFFIGAQTDLNAYGYTWPLWGLILGLLINALNGAHRQMAPAIKPEFYLKVGLMILSSTLLIKDVLVYGLYYGFLGLSIFLASYFAIRFLIKRKSQITLSDKVQALLASGLPSILLDKQSQRKEANTSIFISLLLAALIPWFFNLIKVDAGYSKLFAAGAINELIPSVASASIISVLIIKYLALKLSQSGAVKIAALKLLPHRKEAHQLPIFRKYRFSLLVLIIIPTATALIRLMIGESLSYSVIDKGYSDFASLMIKWLFIFAFVAYGLSINLDEMLNDLKTKGILKFAGYKTINIIITIIILYIASKVYEL